MQVTVDVDTTLRVPAEHEQLADQMTADAVAQNGFQSSKTPDGDHLLYRFWGDVVIEVPEQ